MAAHTLLIIDDLIHWMESSRESLTQPSWSWPRVHRSLQLRQELWTPRGAFQIVLAEELPELFLSSYSMDASWLRSAGNATLPQDLWR